MQAEHAPKQIDGSARLGGARADFVAGLGRKVSGLRSSLARVKDAKADLGPRDDLRRKLHALASSARMMKFDAMDRAIAEALGALDRTPRDAALDDIDVDAIEQTIEDLPALAWGDGPTRIPNAESGRQRVAPSWSVLVVGPALIAEALMDPLEGERTFTCEATPDTQAAYDLVKTKEPDLVVLDADLPDAPELVEALMDDPLTETVPIVVVGSFVEPGAASRFVAMGVTKTLTKPTSREALRGLCEAALVPEARATRTALGEPTLEELGERLAVEIREALVGRVDPAVRGKRVPLGEGTEVLGAVWGAIARIREVVTSRTDGVVRFAGGPEGALTIAPLLHEPEIAHSNRSRGRSRGIATEVRLADRRVVVADDDPAVVWFLADLLKAAGCTVHEAFDGQQALELAYETTPDLVISDILMPNLDGFSLCRALRRDVALRDVPVILLSWKEDLLQRVRELGANAAGYVRKESDTRAIVARVREALRPRARIEKRLVEEGEVRGRLDTVSIRTLLEIVCATRPDARVSVRDASFLYEVEIRGGSPRRATRTSGDGSFVKGSKVLAALLGVSAGRFTITTTASAIEADLDGNLAAQLARHIARARAATMLLTGSQMTWVTKVGLDEAALTEYLRATPERARLVARRLANGAAPRALVLDGICESSLLDDLLADLAARGAIREVQGAGGEDLLGPTAARLLVHADARAALDPQALAYSPLPSDVEADAFEAAAAKIAGTYGADADEGGAIDDEAPLEPSPAFVAPPDVMISGVHVTASIVDAPAEPALAESPSAFAEELAFAHAGDAALASVAWHEDDANAGSLEPASGLDAAPSSSPRTTSQQGAALSPEDADAAVPPYPTYADQTACADDANAPLCESPVPSPASFEDVVLREVAPRSPAPPLELLPPPPPSQRRTAFDEESSGTPSAHQIVALAEATVIDNTTYGEEIPVDEASAALVPGARPEADPDVESADFALPIASADHTPFVTISTEEPTKTTIPAKKRWPMVAFVAATGVVAWAIFHFSMNPQTAPKQVQKAPEAALEALPPAATSPAPTETTSGAKIDAPSDPSSKATKVESKPAPKAADKSDKSEDAKKADAKVWYSALAAETDAPGGQGLLEVSASEGVIVVDGKARARGLVRLPLTHGAHDVRVRANGTERGATVDVRESRVAHVRF